MLVLLVLIVHKIFRSKLSPAWRYGLWLLVVVRLLMPASPQSAISIFNLAKFTPRPVIAPPAAPSRMEAPAIPISDLQARPQASDNRAANSSAGRTEMLAAWRTDDDHAAGAVTTRSLRPKRPIDWFGMACAVWLGGVGLLGLRLVWANVRFGSRLARHRPVADATIIRLVEDCANRLRTRCPVSVIETEEVASPAVCGLWKKRLLVPDGVFERFSSEELRHIFLHELAHVKRRDVEVNWLAVLLQILHRFNPVLWLAFEWNDAPAERFQLQIEKDGFITQHKNVDAIEGRELAVELDDALRIMGNMQDAETKEPLREFHIDWMDRSEPQDFANGYPFSTIPGSNGVYLLDLGRLYASGWAGGYAHQCIFRVEADGYATFVSRVFASRNGDFGEVSPYNVELKRTAQIFGTVVDANGRPVPGAQVGLKMPASRLFLQGKPEFSASAQGASFRQTDAQGRFHLNTDPAAAGLVAVHDEGFAAIGSNELSSNLTVKLQPWGRIEGTVWEYDKLVTNQAIWGSAANRSPSESLHTEFRTNTDAQGRFVFEFVPPGQYSVYRMIPTGGGGSSGGPHEVVQVQPGKTTAVKVGGAGRPVVGRMKIMNPYVAIDWSGGRNHFYTQSIYPRPPTNFTTREQIEAWVNQPEIQKARAAIRNYPMRMAAGGSFRMEEVRPGKYEMQIEILDPRDPNAMAYSKHIANATKAFEVPEPDAREPLDIGVFEISLKQDPSSPEQWAADKIQ